MPDGPGLEPSPMRAGAGQDVFESDVLSVAARHTEDWVRSRTHDRASNRARTGLFEPVVVDARSCDSTWTSLQLHRWFWSR